MVFGEECWGPFISWKNEGVRHLKILKEANNQTVGGGVLFHVGNVQIKRVKTGKLAKYKRISQTNIPELLRGVRECAAYHHYLENKPATNLLESVQLEKMF